MSSGRHVPRLTSTASRHPASSRRTPPPSARSCTSRGRAAGPALAEFTALFHACNSVLWAAYRRGDLSLDELRLERFAAVTGRLAAAGAPVRWDGDFPGMRRFYSEDPFGNRLEFLEPVAS